MKTYNISTLPLYTRYILMNWAGSMHVIEWLKYVPISEWVRRIEIYGLMNNDIKEELFPYIFNDGK